MNQPLYSGLDVGGFDEVCMEARQVNAAPSAMWNKTDKNDARGIAQILRTDWFSPVPMKSREAHGVRALLSTRKTLLKKRWVLPMKSKGCRAVGVEPIASLTFKAAVDDPALLTRILG